MDEIEARMKSGEDVQESFAKNIILAREKESLDWLDMAILCAAFMIGGIETVRAFFLVSWGISRPFIPCIDGINYAVVLSDHSGLSRDPSQGPRRT